MKKSILLLAMAASVSFNGSAQNKPGIAVANPNVTGLFVTPEIAAKLIRLELIKLETYTVLDEFDMAGVYEKDTNYRSCLSRDCLISLGEELKVDYTVTGSFDQLGNKIVISLKFIDVHSQGVYKTGMKEFDNQEAELQRMTEILIREMHGLSSPKELSDRLQFKNELITSNNVGKVNNSGPRIGYGFFTGDYLEFAQRPESQGGLDIFPGVSMIGYQIEGQYVGTENFSALVEGVFNIAGLEQGQFIPSIAIMNGFRFGKAGWEFAFGPAFGLKKVSKGFFDKDNRIGGGENRYYSESDYRDYMFDNYSDTLADPSNSQFYGENGEFVVPDASYFGEEYNFDLYHADSRGLVRVNTMFILAAGRTFRAGSLNIPVNVFYSSRKGGGMLGVSVGFNVMKSKKPINPKS